MNEYLTSWLNKGNGPNGDIERWPFMLNFTQLHARLTYYEIVGPQDI